MKLLINKCEICDNQKLDEVLNLGDHPMCDDLIKIGSNKTCNQYPIVILFCKNCNTAYQKFNIEKKILFPRSYHYRARFTSDVVNGMKDLITSLSKKINLEKKLFLDIGCNDGSLLNIASKFGAYTFGIEPTNAYKDCSKIHTIYNSYFDKDSAKLFLKKHGNPDVITFTNVFAHIQDLKALISNLRMILKKETILVIENHYLGSIIKNNQFDTFYHEHPRSYSFKSFEFISNLIEANIFSVDFPKRYGGNIRVFMSRDLNLINLKLKKKNEKNFKKSLNEMNEFITIWKKKMLKKINKLYNKHGKLYCKAFPGRAAILIKLLELDSDIIKCVCEKPNSPKIGHFIPGTRIPIVSDDELDLNTPVVINFAWHIKKEIKDYLYQIGFKNKVIDIL